MNKTKRVVIIITVDNVNNFSAEAYNSLKIL